MALMQALLKIKAITEGDGAIASMARGLGGLKGAADKAQGGLKGLLSSAGGLSGALGSLVPLVSGAGLAAMAKSAIDAADDMNDLSQKTGVSVEQLSRFQQAANASGTSIEGVGAAMIKLNRQLGSGQGTAAEALRGLGLSATDAAGKLKSTDQVMLEVADKFAKMPDGAQKTAAAMALFGKSGADMIPLLNGGRAAVEELSATMTTKFAKSADNLNDKMTTLQGKLLELSVKVGESLLPILERVSDVVIVLADGFSKLPDWLKIATAAAIGLSLVLPTIVSAITGLTAISGALAGIQLGAIIAGWAGAIGPAVAGISAALTGLLAFLTGTVLPALLAVFSGPAGWTVLAVAAVVAMAIAFRQPLMDFFAWLWNWGQPIRKFWVDLWNGAVSLVGRVFNGAAETIKGVFRGILQFIVDRINSAIRLVNNLIRGFNRLPAPDIPLVQPISIPKFADGGFVTRPTVGLVGEAGPEYIIPANRMAAASANYLAGARGGDVLNGSPQINVTTGPVLQQDGRRYVTIDDLERAMRLTAEGVMGRMRTPAARTALGIR